MSLPQNHSQKAQRLNRTPRKKIQRQPSQKRHWNQHDLQASATVALILLITFIVVEDVFYRDHYRTEINRLKKLMVKAPQLNTTLMMRSSLQGEYKQALRNASGYLRKFNHSNQQDLSSLLLSIQQLRIAERIALENDTQWHRVGELQQRLLKLEAKATKLGGESSDNIDLPRTKTPHTTINQQLSP